MDLEPLLLLREKTFAIRNTKRRENLLTQLLSAYFCGALEKSRKYAKGKKK